MNVHNRKRKLKKPKRGIKNQKELDLFVDFNGTKYKRFFCKDLGFKVGSYLCTFAGKGSFARVYKFVHRKKSYALKLFKLNEKNHKVVLGRVTKEVNAMLCLRSNYFVRALAVFCWVKTTKCVGIVMKYCQCSMVNKTIPFSVVKSSVKFLLNALLFCDRKGYMHGDLSCSNLFRTPSGELIFGDLGMSEKYGSDDRVSETTYVTTFHYRAPERIIPQIDDNGNKTYSRYTHRCDVWSLGCLIVEIITGRLLFCRNVHTFSVNHHLLDIKNTLQRQSNPKTKERILKTKNDHYLSIEGIYDPLLLSLLNSMLQVNPIYRLTASQALNHKYFKI